MLVHSKLHASWTSGSIIDQDVNMDPGNFNVTVTDDNGCVLTIDSSIFETTAIVVTSDSLVSPLCAGDTNGLVSIMADSGTAPHLPLVWRPSRLY